MYFGEQSSTLERERERERISGNECESEMDQKLINGVLPISPPMSINRQINLQYRVLLKPAALPSKHDSQKEPSIVAAGLS